MDSDKLLSRLSKLNAKQLAKLLHEHAQIDPVLYEKCCLLVQPQKKTTIETLVRERLADFSDDSLFYDWHATEAFSRELDYLHDLIVSRVLPINPELAAELLEEFVLSDEAILSCCDDSNGYVGAIMRMVVHDWGVAWEHIKSPDLTLLAERVYHAFMGNDYGVRDDIFYDFEKVLGTKGIDMIEQMLMQNLADTKVNDSKSLTVRIGLSKIAKIKQDMDMYIEHKTKSGKFFNSMILDDIVHQFIDCQRAQEAIEWLNKYKNTENKAFKHDYLMLEANLQLGNVAAIKESYWQLFVNNLNLEDFKAVINLSGSHESKSYKKKAVKHALEYKDTIEAVSFLLAIDEVTPAIKLFHNNYDNFDGGRYYELKKLLKLFERHQSYLEVVLICRRLAESILERAKSKIYHYAVSYIEHAEYISGKVDDWKQYSTPSMFIEEIRQAHKLKRAFWAQYEQ